MKIFMNSAVDKAVWSGKAANFKPVTTIPFFTKEGDFVIIVNTRSHQETIIL